TPGLPPARPNQENVALADLHILRLCGVLQVLDGDPVIDRERIGALVSGDVEQHTAPDHLDDARCITLHSTERLWRRHVVEESILAVDVPEGVEMRTGMIVHEGEACGTLLAFGVELPGLRRDAIIPVVLLDNLDADTSRGDHPRHIGSQLLAESV